MAHNPGVSAAASGSNRRERMVRKARLLLCMAVLFLLQTALVHRFESGPVRVDLLMLAAAFLALEADYAPALWGALALGLLRDLGSCGRLGASALVLVPASAALLFVRARLVRDSFWTDLALTFAYLLVCGAAYSLGTALVAPAVPLRAMLLGAAARAAFTTALSPLVFGALTRLGVVAPSAEAGRGST